MRKSWTAAILLLLAVGLSACRTTGVVMWEPCDQRAADITGTDGKYSMVCSGGVWTPVMTVDEFVRASRGEKVVIAPLPERPTSPTTTTPTTTTPATPTTAPTPPTTAPDTSPRVTEISPISGLAQSTVVTLRGANLGAATAMLFNGAAGADFTVVSDTEISAVAPAGSGTAVVTVLTPQGDVISPAEFTFEVPPPSIETLSRSAGVVEGGQTVTISGPSVGYATSVFFGGVPGSRLTLISPDVLEIDTPAHIGGSVDVVIVTDMGSTTATNAFEYGAGPVISRVDITDGEPGTLNIVYGTGFSDATASACGDNAAEVDSSETYLLFSMPWCDPGTLVDITITNRFGATTTPNAFQYRV